MTIESSKRQPPPGKIECPHCGTWVDSKFTHCSKCGNELKAKKKSGGGGKLLLLLIAIVACLWIFSTIGGGGSSSPSVPRATSAPRNALVVYEITGTARRVDLTIENEGGNTEQFDDAAVPYKKTFAVPRGQFVYISAQNQGETGTVKCTITVDGVVLETAESSGRFVIATCSGSAR